MNLLNSLTDLHFPHMYDNDQCLLHRFVVKIKGSNQGERPGPQTKQSKHLFLSFLHSSFGQTEVISCL